MLEVFWIEQTKIIITTKASNIYLSNTIQFQMELAKQAAETTMYGFIT
jgi:hypothetical protein